MSFDYLEILDRASDSPKITKNEWDYEQIALTTRALVKKYGITWDKEVIIPDNPNLADAVFQAALELAEKAGICLFPSGSVLKFNKTELETALHEMPVSLEMGAGQDARTLHARRIMDDRPPIVWAGNPGVPTPEETFLPNVMSWMKEPIVDLVTCGSLTHVAGHEVKTGEASEILAARRELTLLREGLRRVGRPDMGMLAGQSSVTEIGDLSIAHPDYLRPHDAHLVPLLNELAFDERNIFRVVNSLDYGMRNASAGLRDGWRAGWRCPWCSGCASCIVHPC